MAKRIEQEDFDFLNESINKINGMCFKAQSPLMDNSHQIDSKELMKLCREMHQALFRSI